MAETADKIATTVTTTDDEKKRMRERVEALLKLPPSTSTGSVSVSIGKKALSYAVSAGFVPVVANMSDTHKGEADAALFLTSYTQQIKGVAPDPATRPLLFAFNGGPGSSSIWLHLGALGPKRLSINDDGTMPPPPYAVQDNPHTWLEHFDLVFIDPPHTGYSLTASDAARKKMLSVDGDVEALAECIRAHLTRSKRWGSPIYLAGESYGTTRGAALADKLLDLGIALAGVILVSCAMDIQSLDFDGKNDLAYSLFVPGFAATAQYHGKLKGPQAKSGAAARLAAEAFVAAEYLAALHLGARLSSAKRAQIAQRLSELIGLPAQLILDNDLRVSDATFFSELLRDDGKIVGRLESRVTGPLGAKKSRAWDFDPGIEALLGPYTMAANAYFQSALGIVSDQKYAVFSEIAHKEWNWLQGESKGNSYTTTSNALARALRRNPHLRVLVASGYYDLGTPYSASDWSLARLDLTDEVMARITHHYYDAGHMMYTRTDDLLKLKADLKSWLQA